MVRSYRAKMAKRIQRRVSFADAAPSSSHREALRTTGSWNESDTASEMAKHVKLAHDAAIQARAVKESVRQMKTPTGAKVVRPVLDISKDFHQNKTPPYNNTYNGETRDLQHQPETASPFLWIPELLNVGKRQLSPQETFGNDQLLLF